MLLRALALALPFVAALFGGCAPSLPPGPTAEEAAAAAAHAAWKPLPWPPPRPPVVPLPLDHCSESEEGFDRWLASVRSDAIEKGVSEPTVTSALRDLSYDPEVIALDREQKPFKMSFEKFSALRVTRPRVARGKRMMADNRELLERITARFGVQPEILVTIWGLETDYGVNTGSMSSLRALATLAYDCKRAARFRGELVSALRILDHHDLTMDELVGAWAGELGQTQFLPSSYEKFGVDFDGDGRVDMVESKADALASTAHYLEGNGWRANGPYQPGSANFEALREWNASEIYRKTIVLFASKIAVR
jgi:membrane-bound lytic murein transglycosylase B